MAEVIALLAWGAWWYARWLDRLWPPVDASASLAMVRRLGSTERTLLSEAHD